MARIALLTAAASRDIGVATARLAGKSGYKACVTYDKACVTYDGPNEPLPVPDSVRLKHTRCNREEHKDRVFLGANG